jgi:hypothetical protein
MRFINILTSKEARAPQSRSQIIYFISSKNRSFSAKKIILSLNKYVVGYRMSNEPWNIFFLIGQLHSVTHSNVQTFQTCSTAMPNSDTLNTWRFILSCHKDRIKSSFFFKFPINTIQCSRISNQNS